MPDHIYVLQKYRMNIKVPGDGGNMIDSDEEDSGDEAIAGRRGGSQRELRGGSAPYQPEGASPAGLIRSTSIKLQQQPQMLQHGMSFEGGSRASVEAPQGVPPVLMTDPSGLLAAAAPTLGGAPQNPSGSLSTSSSTLNRKQLEDALLFQMELQKKLHEQLEVTMWLILHMRK